MSGWSGARVTTYRGYWRARILEADLAGRPLRCPFCPDPVMPGQPFDIDHVVKRDEGGPLGLTNQRPAHAGCNRGDGARVTNEKRSRRRRRIR